MLRDNPALSSPTDLRTYALFVFLCISCSGDIRLENPPDSNPDASPNPDASGVDFCATVTCSNKGTCTVIDGNPSCECIGGYHPEELECVADVIEPPPVEVDCSPENVRCVDDDASDEQEYPSIQEAILAASAGDTIYVRQGLYPEALSIDKGDITIAAFPQEEGKAIVTGAQTIGGWALANPADLNGNPNASRIYEATAPCEVNRLFQGDTELSPSRYPAPAQTGEDRYLHISATSSDTAFASNELSGKKAAGYFEGAMVHSKTTPWTMGSGRVVNSGATGDITVAEAWPYHGPEVDFGFFFTQVVGEISAPGEWAYRDNKLYLLSDSPPADVRAACLPNNLQITTDIQNVEIRGLTFRRAKGDCVQIGQATQQGVKFIGNRFEACGEAGLHALKGQGMVEILDNEIVECRDYGIHLSNSQNAVIRGNTVRATGSKAADDDPLMSGGLYVGTSILVIDSSNTTVTENRVSQSAYGGIMVINFGGAERGRTIAFNHVRDSMLSMNDGGGIYLHVNNNDRATPRDKVTDNIVETTFGSFIGTAAAAGYFSQGIGIYQDNGMNTGYVDFERNTMVGNTLNMFFNSTNQNLVRNNVSFATSKGHYETNFYLTCRENAGNNSVVGNTFVATASNIYGIRVRGVQNECKALLASDENRYFCNGSADCLQDESGQSPFTLAEWQAATGLDQNSAMISVCANPQIVTNPSLHQSQCTGLTGCSDLTGAAVGSSLTLDSFHSQVLCACSGTPTCAP